MLQNHNQNCLPRPKLKATSVKASSSSCSSSSAEGYYFHGYHRRGGRGRAGVLRVVPTVVATIENIPMFPNYYIACTDIIIVLNRREYQWITIILLLLVIIRFKYVLSNLHYNFIDVRIKLPGYSEVARRLHLRGGPAPATSRWPTSAPLLAVGRCNRQAASEGVGGSRAPAARRSASRRSHRHSPFFRYQARPTRS